MHQLFPAPGI